MLTYPVPRKSIISFLECSQLCTVALLFLSFHTCYAQREVEGVIVGENKRPLIGATILETGTENGTVSGIDGSFKLTIYTDSITIQYIGYESRSLAPVNSLNRIVLVQNMNMTYCGVVPIEIRASLLRTEKESVTTLPNNILTIATPASTVEVLNMVPGLHMQSGGYNTNKLTIRGIGSTSQFATSDVKTFYNNIPLHNSIGESAIEDLGLHMADRLEVIKGNTGSDYESGYGGAIIVKNKNITSQNQTNIASNTTLSQWGHLTTQNQIKIGRTNNRKSHNISAYQSYIKDDGYRDNNDFNRNNITLNYTLNNKGKLILTTLANYTKLKASIPSSLNRTDFDNEPTKAAFSWNRSMGNEDYTRILLGVNLDYEFDYRRSISNTIYGQGFESAELRPFNTIDESARTLGAKGNYTYHRQQNNQIYKIGYRVQNEKYRYDLFDTEIDIKGLKFDEGMEDRWISEIYGNVSANINDKWTYTLGTNIQHANIAADETTVMNKTFISPDAMITYRLDANKRVYLNSGRGVNYFSPQEALLPDGSYNQSLRPSDAWNISLGSKGIIKRHIQYRTEIYQMWISNILTTERDDTDQAINANSGSASYRGLELALRYNLAGTSSQKNHNLSIDAQYNLMHNVYGNYVDDANDYSGNKIPGAPQQTVTTIINGNYFGLFGNIRYQYIDAYHMRDNNTILSDAYHLMSATMGYQWQAHRWSIIPRIDLVNAANIKYASMTLVNAGSFNGTAPRYYYPGRPRHIRVSLGIQYSIG